MEELSREIVVFSHTVTVEISEENLYKGIVVQGEPSLRDIFILFANANDNTGCILFLCSYVVAIGRYINHYGNVYYLLFDSHSRNSRGITDSQPAYSILIKFARLYEVERYIEEAYHIVGSAYAPYFQVQFITVHIDSIDLLSVQNAQINYFRRIKIATKTWKNRESTTNK